MATNLEALLGKERYEDYLKNKEYLKNISWYVLPKKPSSSGFNADDIRRKNYEPILQLYDWLYEVKGEVDILQGNAYKQFIIDIGNAIVIDNPYEQHEVFDTYLTSEQVSTIETFKEYDMMKELSIKINDNYVLVHTTVEEDDTYYYLYGLGINTARDTAFKMNISINKNDYHTTGTIDNNYKESDIQAIIDNSKDDIVAICKEIFVPKSDMVEIDSITLSNGEVETPLTTGGFVQIKTYKGE